jgi:hypothetical protein
MAATLLATACGHADRAVTTPTAPTPPTGAAVRVFGRVLDFTTNAGVAGASIDFYISGLNAVAASVITDGAGRYSVSLPPGARYDARINGPAPDSNRGTIMPVAKETEADFLINGGTCIVFYGTVRDLTTGEPISGASVAFDRAFPTAHTSGDGSYRLDLGCPTPANPWRWPGTVGTTFMRVSREGYIAAGAYGGRIESLSSAGTQRIDVALQPSS